MSDDDLTIRVDLDISPAEKKLSELDNDINSTLSKTISGDDGDFSMSDSVFERTVSERGTQEVGKNLNSSIEKFSSFITSIPDRFSRSAQGAVDNWKDIFSKLNIGKKDFGEPDYEFLKMEQDSERAVDVPKDEIDATDSVFARIVHENERMESVKRIEDANLSDFGADDFSKGWSQEGSDAYSRFKLQQEKLKAQIDMKDYDELGDEEGARNAAERFAMADGALRASRLKKKVDSQGIKQDEVTDENKQQNREYTEQIFKLGKILALLTAIKGVIAAARKLGGAVIDTVTKNTEKTKQEYSLLTVDPLGASRASTDRLNASMLEGTRNLGADSPFSGKDWLDFQTKIQTTKEDALTGSVNTDMAIAFQWLTKLGTGFNAEQLLTGDPSRSNAEIAKEMADAIEKALSSKEFWSQDEITRSQTLKYLRAALGENIVNGIWYNASINRITGENQTATDRILEHGGAANVNDATPITTRKINNALAELTDSLSLLSKTFQNTFEPAITGVINKLSSFTDWLQGKVALGSSENRQKRKLQFYDTVDEIDSLINAKNDKRITVEPIRTESSKNWVVRNRDKVEEEARLRKSNSARKIQEKYGTTLNKMGNKPQNVSELFTAMILDMPTAGTSQWFQEVGEDYMLKNLAKQAEGLELAVNEYDSHGNVKTSVNKNFKDGWQKDLAQLIINSTSSTEAANSLSAQEILSLLKNSDEGIELVNKYFNEGKLFDFDEEDPLSFAGMYEKILGKELAEKAMLNIMDMISNSKEQSKYKDMHIEISPENKDVFVHIETTNNGTKTELVVPITYDVVKDNLQD